MRSVTIERKVLTGLAVALFTALVVGIALYRSGIEIISTQEWVEHTKQALDQLDDLLQSLVDLNSAWAGYELTHDKKFLVRIDQLKEIISTQFDKIETKDNAQRIALLRSARDDAFKSIGEAENPEKPDAPPSPNIHLPDNPAGQTSANPPTCQNSPE